MAVRRAEVVEVGKRLMDEDPQGVDAGCKPHSFASTCSQMLEPAPVGHEAFAKGSCTFKLR